MVCRKVSAGVSTGEKAISPGILKLEMQRFDFPRVVVFKPQQYVVLRALIRRLKYAYTM